MLKFIFVFLGAGLGGLSRFLLGPAVQGLFNGWSFPIGTFVVNMIGCLIIGFLAELSELRGVLTGELRLLVMVGVLGGFTTFSSFGLETMQLIKSGEIAYAVTNVIGQSVLGVLLVWIGSISARALWG